MYDSADEQINHVAPKERRCLNCAGSFQSLWAGERVCKACKQTSSWRSGISSKPASTR